MEPNESQKLEQIAAAVRAAEAAHVEADQKCRAARAAMDTLQKQRERAVEIVHEQMSETMRAAHAEHEKALRDLNLAAEAADSAREAMLNATRQAA